MQHSQYGRRTLVWTALACLVWAMLLSGCGSSLSRSGGSLVADACKSNTNAPDEACECIGRQADAELSEPAAVWLATAMRGETEKALELKEAVPWTELVEASMFMMKAGQNCALDAEAMPTIE